MAYSPLPQPDVPDWKPVIDAQGYSRAADAMADEDYPGAINALTRIGQVGQAALVKNTWQTPAENYELNKNVGNALAAGNPKEAENIALRDGNFDIANHVRNRQNAISNQSLIDSNRALEKTSNLLAALKDDPTPEKWAQVRQAAIASGRYSPQEIAKIDTMIQQNGIGQTADFYHRQLLGAAGQLQEIQNQRKPIIAGIGELAADQKISDEDWQKMAAAYAAAHNNPDWLKPYLTAEGRRLALAEAGKTVETQRAAGRTSAQASIAGPRGIQDDFKKEYGVDLPLATANEAWKEGRKPVLAEDGTIKYAEPEAGSRAAMRVATTDYRKARTNPEVVRELAEYNDIGKRDGALAQRKSIAGGALNHLETVSQIADKDLENAIGVIQGTGGYQKFLDAVKSGRIENSAAYHNAQQTLSVLLREVQNAYHIAGTGADTDARLKETADALSPESILRSPNIQVFRQRLDNIRAILQGVVNSPRPSAFGSREPATAGSKASEQEVRRVSGFPEEGGKVARPEKITSKADYDALPSGAEFIAPDGSHRRKP